MSLLIAIFVGVQLFAGLGAVVVFIQNVPGPVASEMDRSVGATHYPVADHGSRANCHAHFHPEFTIRRLPPF